MGGETKAHPNRLIILVMFAWSIPVKDARETLLYESQPLGGVVGSHFDGPNFELRTFDGLQFPVC